MSAAVLWTDREAAAATGGRATGTWRAEGISIDSRTASRGDLFVALGGNRVDGHDFVARVIGAGAAAGMVAHRPGDVAKDAPLLLVDDTLVGLTDLGRAGRARARARVVGVTGSVGKTGTKELLARALGAIGATHASQASHNNDIGVPLTLARLPENARFAICEMGMNHAGELAELTRLVRPDIAIVTTVEATHLGHFSGIEAIADAKAEIFDGMGAAGTAVLNRDSRFFDRLAAAARTRGISRIVGFGESREADVRLRDYAPATGGSRVVADVCGREVVYELRLDGRHWALNSLAVLGAVHALDADVVAAAAAMGQVMALVGRGARHRVACPGGHITLIDESYNASPASMRAAIAVLGANAPQGGGRRIAVLGDMLEMGADADASHAALASALIDVGIDLIFTAGAHMAHLHEALPGNRRGAHAADSALILNAVRGELRSGDVVMVKGSLGSRMARVVQGIMEAGDAL